MSSSLQIPSKYLNYLTLLMIVVFCVFPCFMHFPYRINIFLSWEGAYRMYLGQVPFKDFGLPMGYGYWLIPTAFFKLFSPNLFTLVIAQAFINFISALAVRKILRIFQLTDSAIFLSLLIFCITYIFLNYWPWYNHTAFVFGLIGLCFLLMGIVRNKRKGFKYYVLLMLSSLFSFLAFFTKQDYGALFIVFAVFLLFYDGYHYRSVKNLALYIGFTFIIAVLFVVPLLPYNLTYWFNMGQAPHSSRLSYVNFLEKILGASDWEKFYLIIIVSISLFKYKNLKVLLADYKSTLFLLFTLGIFCVALITKVTSVLALGNDTFFHAFAIAFIIANLPITALLNRPLPLGLITIMMFLWMSSFYWKYVAGVCKLPPTISFNRVVQKATPAWIESDLPSFKNISLPASTVAGMQRLKLRISDYKQPVSVLNMTELTPLARDLGFVPLKQHPLWYHLNVGIFDKQVNQFCKNIENQQYDVVLFESIPAINNFFPFQVQKCLNANYILVDTFEAPRKVEEGCIIEVYVSKE